MNDRHAEPVIDALRAELRRYITERRTGTITVSVRFNQGGIADNRFTVSEERKAE